MDDYVAARSDDIPEIDAMTLMECVMTSDCYTAAGNAIRFPVHGEVPCFGAFSMYHSVYSILILFYVLTKMLISLPTY